MSSHGSFPQAAGRQLDGALSRARHRARVVRGLDLAGVLRARAEGDLQARLAERRSGGTASAQRAATSPRSSQVANTSIIVVRDTDGEVRAFHNICRHRGNKLVWNDIPREETSGTCRQFTCKYHGWRYDLDGEPDLRAAGGRVLRPRQEPTTGWCRCTATSGRASSSSTSPRSPEQSLREFLGPMITGLEGYPFDEMTERWYYRSEVKANWKLYMDAFQEFYHAPVLHANQSPSKYSNAAAAGRLRGAALPHRRSAPPGEHLRHPGVGAGPGHAQADRGDLSAAGFSGRGTSPTSAREAARGREPGQVRPVGPRLVPAVPELRRS